MFNPFPGLRPFEPEEDHLFFGREKEIDELVRRLRSTRLLSVIGTSGSGKSSLVRSGLITALQSGVMVHAGSGWRVAKFRPSEDPIGNLAVALDASDVLGTEGELASTNRVLLEATLRRGTLGLVNAVRQARIPRDENLLVVVDQFEDLFRFRRSRHIENSKDEAMVFVRLLLEAVQQDEIPIFIVLTMRSDFIGDCMEFNGLPEAVNAGQYLIPRMKRAELRLAITGPVAVGGGEIASRLVLRLLNDLGDEQDQLPVLQHALMRTWDFWEQHRAPGEPIDIAHYEAVGTLRQALSLHAEEAYQETRSGVGRHIAERMFKALTDTFTDHRGVRRPSSVRQIAAICEASESQVIEVIELFRRPGRSFLTPPATTPLGAQSAIDLSHESLMRCWTRLSHWADEERISARTYDRLSQAASWFEEGTAGLWRDPELELGLQWKRRNLPTAAWAAEYNSNFVGAMEFLEQSEKERDRVVGEQERERKKKLSQYQWAAGVLTILLVVVGWLAYVARRENTRAEGNLGLAQKAVDEMLSSAGRQPARVAEDVPQLEEFRKELLDKARGFYAIFTTQKPDSEKLRHEMARAHFRLGDIYRLLQEPGDAVKEYNAATTQFESLAKDYPRTTEYRRALAGSYNWLGETLRISPTNRADADQAYASALRLQQEMVRDDPGNTEYPRELARTHYNRGILRYSTAKPEDSESDFRAAIQLLKPLAEKEQDLAATQELARAYNNLGTLLRREERLQEARELYENAIAFHERLAKQEPGNREYKQELATFNNNLALLLVDEQQVDAAQQRNRQALNLIEELASPPFSLGMELANAHNLRCQMLEADTPGEAETECQRSLDILNRLVLLQTSRDRPEFQRLFRDLGYNYLDLATGYLGSGSVAEARRALARLSSMLPKISEPDRSQIGKSYQELQQKLINTAAKPQLQGDAATWRKR
jgi:tetratricopeptide (TPR) repeat protein